MEKEKVVLLPPRGASPGPTGGDSPEGQWFLIVDQKRQVLRAHLACPPPAWPLRVQHKKQEGVTLAASAVTPGLGGQLTPGG